MNKKSQKSTEWYLLEVHCAEALKDKNLNQTDRNVLSVLLMLNNLLPHDKRNTFFRTDEKLLEDLEVSECPISGKQLQRVRLKLKTFGYIGYVSGYHNNKTGKGSATIYWIENNSSIQRSEMVDTQLEEQNNVHPNTNTKSNTKSNTNLNTKSNTDISTSNISVETERNDMAEERREVLDIRNGIDNGTFGTISQLETRLRLVSHIIGGGWADDLKRYYNSKCK